MDRPLSIACYLLIVELLGLLFIPLVAVIFRSARGRGLGFARPLAILSGGYFCWLLASLHALPFGAAAARSATILICIPVVLAGMFLLRRVKCAPALSETQDTPDPGSQTPGPVSRLRANVCSCESADRAALIREALRCEAIFWLFFAVFFAAMWFALGAPYGERTLDLALFTALDRAEYFPPPDTWLAGARLNYYYFGHLLGVYLAELAGLSAAQGYCLFWALLPALTAAAAYSLARMLLPRSRWAALWGPALVLLAGNFSIIRDYCVHGQFFPPAYFYNMTRVIPFTINENPLLSVLIGEVHANTIVLPFYLVLIGTVFQLMKIRNLQSEFRNKTEIRNLRIQYPEPGTRNPEPKTRIPDPRPRTRCGELAFLLLAALTAFVYGALIAINYWDIAPCGFFILCVLLLYAPAGMNGAQILRNIVQAILSFVGIAALAYLFYLPFHWNFGSTGSKLEILGLRSTTRALDLLIHPGLVFVLPVCCLFFQFQRSLCEFVQRKTEVWNPQSAICNPQPAIRIPADNRRFALHSAISLALLLLILRIVPPPLRANALLFCCLLLASAALWRARFAPPQKSFPLLLCWCALAILWGCEIFNVRGPSAPEEFRQNTVFRFYLPAIVFLAIASAVGARRILKYPVVLRRAHERRVSNATAGAQWLSRLNANILIAALLIGLIQPVLGTIGRGRGNWRATRLDAAIHLAFRTPSDYPAIHWLAANLPPGAVIAEHPGPAPYGAARYSMGSGLATILGDPHKLQTRGVPQAELDRREAELREIYHSRDWRRIEQLLGQYAAQYVIYPLNAPEYAADPYRAGMDEAGSSKYYYYNRQLNAYDPQNRLLFLQHARKIWSRYNLEIFQLNFPPVESNFRNLPDADRGNGADESQTQ